MKLVRRALPAGVEFSDDTHELVKRVFAMRGILTESQISTDLKFLHPVSSLKQIKKATRILCEAISSRQKILIIGDFDADGATATALTVRALRLMGHTEVDYLVPNRFEYGYGLSPEIVEEARKYQPDLIITVDNGISSLAGVRSAKALGFTVIITDHHLPGKKLPNADAIVNPNQPDDTFASKNLAGVGVVFYLMLSVKNALQKNQYFKNNGLAVPNLAELLDLVALGTVADVVPLDQNNRILVEQGLRRIRHGSCCAGISALFQIARKNPQRAVSTDLGFVCGPRLNAAGRLDDMSLGIECLLTDDPPQAMDFAAELNSMNLERRNIEETMKLEALQFLREFDETQIGFEGDAGVIPPVICLYKEDWHQGVVGILAARIRERFHRPAIIFASASSSESTFQTQLSDDPETNEIKPNDRNTKFIDTELKASARSIPGLHIRDILDKVATENPGLLDKFGGHAMAAGLSLKKSSLNRFIKAVNEVVEGLADEDVFQEVHHSDGELREHHFDRSSAEALRYAAPWGQHFPPPLFDNVFIVMQKKILGEKHLKLQLRPIDQSRSVPGIAFNVDLDQWPEEGEQVHLLYQLDVNEYAGNCSLQLVIEKRLG